MTDQVSPRVSEANDQPLGGHLPAAIERWENAGGTWWVSAVSDDLALTDAPEAIVDLLRCDGGEIVDRVRLSDPHEVRWARVQQAAQTSTMRP